MSNAFKIGHEGIFLAMFSCQERAILQVWKGIKRRVFSKKKTPVKRKLLQKMILAKVISKK